jgi:hypothetical protein
MAEPRLRLSLDVTAVPLQPVGAGQYTMQLAIALAARPDVDLVAIARHRDGQRWSSAALHDARTLVGAIGGDGS